MGLALIHPSAIVAPDSAIGEGTKVWAFCQVREGARIGRECILGYGCYIGEGVVVGDRVKMENGVYLFPGATVEDGAFLGPRAMLLNDLVPRAVTLDGRLKGPDDWQVGRTVVRRGASVGAGSLVLPGREIGAFGLIGAGSVVTHDVPPHALVFGNPARMHGFVCACGEKLASGERAPPKTAFCARCGTQVSLGG